MGVIANLLIIIICDNYFKEIEKIDFLIKYNTIMIAFNLFPIYPLDGYRFLNDLFKLDKNYIVREIFFYLGILILVLGIIISFMFKYYATIILFLYLISLNCYKMILEYQKRFSYRQLMYYDLNKYRLKYS